MFLMCCERWRFATEGQGGSKGRIRLASPQTEYVILRPSRFSADLPVSNNMMAIQGGEESLERLVYQKTSLNLRYGRVERCRCTDLMAHAREVVGDLYRWKRGNTLSTGLVDDVAIRREHLEKMNLYRETLGDGDGGSFPDGDLARIIHEVAEIDLERTDKREPAKWVGVNILY